MTFPAGARLGPYDILALIGSGGMGEVYRAHDSRLGRDVAIKVLPAAFADDSDRLRRFEQEARAAAALNHPNILHILDIGRDETTSYVVSELLDGETLRALIERGGLPLSKAIDYARQIALGLAAAHAKGITHRDIKPENVFVMPDGRVKILDFGLAKVREETGVTESTRLHNSTGAGVVLGTAGYMAPEQVRAQPADARSDIFSAGVVLFEMVAGRRPFQGDSAVETMNAILTEDPADLTLENSRLPPAVNRIVRHCLEKSPGERFQSARDLAFALEALSGSGASSDLSAMAQAAAPGRSRLAARAPWIVAAVTTTALLASLLCAAGYFRRALAEPLPVRFAVTVPPQASPLINFGMHNLALSPDGHGLAFVASAEGQTRIWFRALGAITAVPIAGTEGAYSPFWSPDSKYIGFFANAKLKRIEPSGASLQTICALSSGLETTGTWGRDNIILFMDLVGDRAKIHRVGVFDGSSAPLPTPDAFQLEHWITFLPDGQHFLARGRTGTDPATDGAYLGSLGAAGVMTLLLPHVGTRVEYSRGHLLYVRDGSLLAQSFDEKTLRLGGPAITVVERLAYFDQSGWSEFSVSQTGVLAYMTEFPAMRLAWLDRSGRELGPVGSAAPALYSALRLSPDNQKLAYTIADPRTTSGDVWILDLPRGTKALFASGPTADDNPVWSPNGKSLVYFSCCPANTGPNDTETLWIKDAADTGKGRSLLPPGFHTPRDWSRDGRFLLYEQWRLDKTKVDLWVLPMDGGRKPFPFQPASFSQGQGRVSPDGHSIAFVSDETGREEVYVAGFDGHSGEKQLVSTAGGRDAAWRSDGKELFIFAPDRSVLSAKVEPGFHFTTPTVLFRNELIFALDVANDGQRFVAALASSQTGTSPFTVVLNWPGDLKR